MYNNKPKLYRAIKAENVQWFSHVEDKRIKDILYRKEVGEKIKKKSIKLNKYCSKILNGTNNKLNY